MRGLRIGQRVRHFAEREWFIKLWVFPVWIGLGVASLAIAAMPFKRIASRLGAYCGTAKPHLGATVAQESRAIQIGRTVHLAASYAPWRADCYPQAIVARLLLGLYRLPFTLSLGLRRDAASGAAQAHAWVECGKVCVTGGDGASEHRTVAVFASQVAD